MLGSLCDSRPAIAEQTSKLSRAGPRDHEIRLLRHAVLEYSGALEHKAAAFPCNAPNDPIEATKVAEPSPRYIIKYSTWPSPAISPVKVFVPGPGTVVLVAPIGERLPVSESISGCVRDPFAIG